MDTARLKRYILWGATGRPDGPPELLHLRITLRCNARCQMCAVRPDRLAENPYCGVGPGQADLDAAVIGGLLDEARRLGVGRVTLQGGEPCLHPDFAEVLATVARAGFDVKTFTNGSADPEVFERAASLLGPGRRLTVNLSVDGLGEVNDRIRGAPGLFGRADRLARRLAALAARRPQQVDAYVYSVVMRDNADSLFDIAAHFYEVGLPCVFHPVHIYGPELVDGRLLPRQYLPARLVPTAPQLRRLKRHLDVLEWHPGVGSCAGLRFLDEIYRGPQRKVCIVGSVGVFVNADGTYVGCPNFVPRVARLGEAPLAAVWYELMAGARAATFLNCHVPCIGSYCVHQALPGVAD